LSAGALADVTVFDPDHGWVCDRADTGSKSRNNPFHGWVMKGRATHTIVGGQLVWRL
jgi:dihydroorotase